MIFNKGYDKNIYVIIDSIMKLGGNPNFSCRKFSYGKDFATDKFRKVESKPYKPMQLICSYKENKSELSIKLVKLLLQYGAEINGDFYQFTPLVASGASGNLKLMKFLISKGGNVYQVNSDGDNILFPTVEVPYVNIVEYLLDNTSIDVNQKNNEGRTAVFELVEPIYGIPKKNAELKKYKENMLKTLQLLIDHGTKLNIIDKSGLSLLGSAIKADNPYLTEALIKRKRIAEFLEQNGVKVNKYSVSSEGVK